MSKLNIQGIVDSIKGKTNIYTPLIEAIVNSIQSIDIANKKNGKIIVKVIREKTLNITDDTLEKIIGFEIIDNGIGFNEKNRESFDTFYSAEKREIGGKGFGRFLFHKYFGEVKVSSIYKNSNEKKFNRDFTFGKQNEIITNETNEETDIKKLSTSVFLHFLKKEHSYDKKINTIARKLLENLLIYFIDDKYKCPEIILQEQDGAYEVSLNKFLEKKQEIQLLNTKKFTLSNNGTSEKFNVKFLKI